jgi:hypothetical protein
LASDDEHPTSAPRVVGVGDMHYYACHILIPLEMGRKEKIGE